MLLFAGCSRFVVDGPPMRPTDRGPIECTDHSIAPVVDTALVVATALAAGAAGVYVATTPWDDNGTAPIPSFHHVAFPFVFVGLVLISAVPFGFYGSEQYGARTIASCQRAKAERARVEAEQRTADGDCAAAIRIGAQIRTLDEPTFDDYARDRRVATCSSAQ